MAIVTIDNDNEGSWPDVAALPGGYFVNYFPQPRILRLRDPNGATVAETGVPGGVMKFAAYVAPSGEARVVFSDFNNDQKPWPWRRWDTGAMIGVPSSGGGGTDPNLIAAIKAKLAELSALIAQLQ